MLFSTCPAEQAGIAPLHLVAPNSLLASWSWGANLTRLLLLFFCLSLCLLYLLFPVCIPWTFGQRPGNTLKLGNKTGTQQSKSKSLGDLKNPRKPQPSWPAFAQHLKEQNAAGGCCNYWLQWLQKLKRTWKLNFLSVGDGIRPKPTKVVCWVDRVGVSPVPLIMDLFFRAKGSHLFPDPCLMPHHIQAHRVRPEAHTAGLANCKVGQTGLEATQGALKVQQRHTQTQGAAPPTFPSPRAITSVLLISAAQVRGLTMRNTAHVLFQSKQDLPAGIWSNHSEWCCCSPYARGRAVSPLTFTVLMRKASISAPIPPANFVFPSRIQKIRSEAFFFPFHSCKAH